MTRYLWTFAALVALAQAADGYRTWRHRRRHTALALAEARCARLRARVDELELANDVRFLDGYAMALNDVGVGPRERRAMFEESEATWN